MSEFDSSRRLPLSPPLQQRRVQVSLAAAASLLLAGLLVSASGRPAIDREPVPRAANVAARDERALGLKIDLNRADARELALLPGVGPVLAGRIVRSRRQQGDFDTVRHLDRVRGIGAKTIQAVAPLCTTGMSRDHEPAAEPDA